RKRWTRVGASAALAPLDVERGAVVVVGMVVVVIAVRPPRTWRAGWGRRRCRRGRGPVARPQLIRVRRRRWAASGRRPAGAAAAQRGRWGGRGLHRWPPPRRSRRAGASGRRRGRRTRRGGSAPTPG